MDDLSSRTLSPSGLLGTGRKGLSWIAKQATRRAFGNSVSRQKNLAGTWGWLSARRAYDGVYDRETHAAFRRLRYLRIPPEVVDGRAVAAVRQRFEEIILDDGHARCPFRSNKGVYDKYNYGNLSEELPVVRRDLIAPLRSIPIIRELFGAGLLDVLRTCLASHFVVDEVDAWRNYHVPEQVRAKFEATNDRWHFDHHRCDRLRLFINLSDVTPDDGPTEFFDHPTSAELIRYGYENALRAKSETGGIPPEVIASHPRRLSCAGPSGAAVAMQTSYCLHRGGTRKPGHHRDLIAFTMQPAASTRVLPLG